MSCLRVLIFCLLLLFSASALTACADKCRYAGNDNSDSSVKIKGQMDTGVEGGRGL